MKFFDNWKLCKKMAPIKDKVNEMILIRISSVFA